MTALGHSRRLPAAAALLVVVAGLAACGGGGGGTSDGNLALLAAAAQARAQATPPAANPGTTDPAVTQPPATDPPATDPPATDPPVTQPPETDPGSGPVRKWGYITLPNGDKMRYSLTLPSGTGSFPLVVEYDGYLAGSTPGLSAAYVADGYAAMGINVPGTGCSTGDDQVFDASVGAAGAFAIEWAGKQPWSNGKIGMVGSSYSGYTQLWVAAQRPKGLLAITPSKDVGDPYRDVGYPGGIKNIGFPTGWWGGFPALWNQAAAVAASVDGDTECAKTVADNIEKIKRPDLDLNVWLEDPYADGLYIKRSAALVTGNIDIPTLGSQSWQDEQVGPRAGYYEDTISPENMWLVSSNGDHGTILTSGDLAGTIRRFLAHFVKGEDNGFEKEPHARLLQEMQQTNGVLVPRQIVELDRLPAPVTPMRLWMQPDGVLAGAMPTGASAASTYRYPANSPMVNNPNAEGWPAVPDSEKDGQLTFTTAPLPQDLSFYGEGSADLYINATAGSTDLQVTVSEVRPDGKEMFVQRGWMRASKRALDPARTTELRPFGAFTQATEAPLAAGQPNLVRIEIQKFAHVFRANSSLRVTIDTPSQTGYWVFGSDPTASTNTLWHDRTHASSIVLGYIPYAHAQGLPSCDTTMRQPCRDNAIPVPPGIGPRAPT